MQTLQLIPRSAWLLIAAVVCADVVLCASLGLSVEPSSFAVGIIGFAGTFALAWIYTEKRPDAKLAMLAMSASYLILFTSVCAVFSYAMVSIGFPLYDSALAEIDRKFGLDWMAALEWSGKSEIIAIALRIFYGSSLPHIVLVVSALAFSLQHDRLRAFITLFAITGLLTCFISGVVPASGAYTYYLPSEEIYRSLGLDAGLWHLQQFNDLRDGTMRVIDLSKTEGLVTFPSFHTALAVVCGWATWQVSYVKWPSAILTVLIIIATPVVGGHYFIDIAAGAALAWAAIWLVQRQSKEAVTAADARGNLSAAT